MSITAGPNSINDGLVFSVDATNARSFRGEPTVNVIKNPIFNSRWSIANFQSSGFININNGVLTVTGLNPNNVYPRIIDDAFTNNISGFYCISVEAISSSTGSFRINMYDPQGSTRDGKTFNIIDNTSWQRYSQTGYLITYQLNRPYIFPSTSGVNYSFRNLQITNKAYDTPFVSGIRGLSVESGGGWADLSKNNNHCIFDPGSGIQFTGINLGSLHFSGDYAYVSPILGSNYPASYEIVIYPMSFNNSILLGMNNHTNAYDGISFLNNKLIVYFGEVNYRYSPINTPNQWYHILVTVPSPHAKDCTIYVNGNVNQESSVHTGVPINLDRIVIGASSRFLGSNPFHGNISIVRIYNRALSESEVKQNFESLRGRFGL